MTRIIDTLKVRLQVFTKIALILKTLYLNKSKLSTEKERGDNHNTYARKRSAYVDLLYAN